MSEMSEEYTEAANKLTAEIRRLSPAAADCVEQIRTKFGVRSAYLAAFALVIYQIRITQTSHSPFREDLKSFTYYEEMQEIPEAVQLYEEAGAHLLAAGNSDHEPPIDL